MRKIIGERRAVQTLDIAIQLRRGISPNVPRWMVDSIFHRPAASLPTVAPVMLGNELFVRTCAEWLSEATRIHVK